MSPDSDCYSEEQLIACLKGTLPEVQRKAVETHVAGCDSCTKMTDDIKVYLLRDCGSDGEGDHVPREGKQHDAEQLSTLEPAETAEYLGKLNGYDIIRVLGRGGYGIVFEALDNALHRSVAIKVLTSDLARQEIPRRRFIREARACASINHPNVVTIHGVDDSGETPFIVMELIQGETLRERIRREPKLDLLDILRIGSQAAQGLAAAHAQGIIHRDVKPGNIMLLDQVRVKIADFGLARVATENVELTSHGVAVGTPAYMSPEQVRGEELDPRTDLFALGCVMYSMFTGHSPFHGRTALEIAMRIETHHPPRLGEISKGIPEFLDTLVGRLLEKNRDKRFQSAAEVADVLSRHLTILNQTPTDKFPVALRMSMIDPSRKATRWRWALALGVFTMLAGVLILGGWIYFRSAASNAELSGADSLSEPTPNGGSSVPQHQRTLEATVAQTGDADFQTIGDALRGIAAGGTVTIQDDAEYAETISLADAARYAGVRIVSPKHASIRSEQHPLVKIQAVPGVRLEGLRIIARQEQFGIELTGDCPGTELLDLEIERIDNPDWETKSNAAIVFRNSAAGTAERPIRLRRLVCHATNVGIVIVGKPAADEAPPRHIVVEECVVRGRSRDHSTLLAVLRNVEDVEIHHNLFSLGVRAISVVADEQELELSCDISHNTWHDVENWFGWMGPERSNLSLTVQHNLIVDSGQNKLPSTLIATFNGLPPAFTGNVAIVPAATDRVRFSPLAEVVDVFPLVSRDSNDPDYLKPDFELLEPLGFTRGSVPGRYPGDQQE